MTRIASMILSSSENSSNPSRKMLWKAEMNKCGLF
ncbi:hypothetical protein N7474_008991 [Penicillium riverlandense]|nr:uncharacterized protein N7474_008991 [Penicillium riverlandense]KAJ5807722.1 hypothetical protein N7474_008991 [Penicillium riverlandense]